MKNLNVRYVFLTVFLAVYMFLATTSLSMVHVDAKRFMDPSMQELLYYCTQGAMCLGYICFILSRRLLTSRQGRVGAIFTGMALYIVSVIIVYSTPSIPVYFAFGLLVELSAGFLGAFVYYCMSASLVDSPHMGKIIGLGGAIAIVIQYFTQIYYHTAQLLPALMIISFSMLTWLLWTRPFDWLILDYLPYESRNEEEEKSFQFLVFGTVLVIILLVLIPLFYDSWLMRMSVSNQFMNLNAYTWPRLFMAGGYLYIGFLADFKKGHFVHIGILSITLLGILYLIPETEWSMWFGMCLFYFHVAAIFGYGFYVFWRLAPRTKMPELFPSLGKFLEYLLGMTMGLTNILSVYSFFIMRLMYMIFVFLLLFMMAGMGQLDLRPVRKKEQEETDPFQVLRDYFQLTPKEEEVARQLVMTEMKTQEIADALFVSRRVIQRYISSIYEKTGTKSRVGLYQLYHDIILYGKPVKRSQEEMEIPKTTEI